LLKAQEADGTWDPARWGGSREYLPAVTGFAVMALVRDGDGDGAGGGRRAVEEVKRADTHAVVAVACEKDLVAGVLATLPKPVLAVHNTRPCGACRDTSVDPDEVEKAIRSLLFFPFL